MRGPAATVREGPARPDERGVEGVPGGGATVVVMSYTTDIMSQMDVPPPAAGAELSGDAVLGDCARARRIALHLSQAEVAERLGRALPRPEGVGQSYVSQVEHARIWTSADRLRALATALETTVAYLIGETPDPERAAATRPRPRSLGIGDSGYTDTARRAGEQRAEPRAWR